MNIEEIVNNEFNSLITELKQTSYKYGCLMLYYTVTKTWWDSIQKKIDDKDICRVNGVIGREKYRDAHVTLLYGLHKIVGLEDVKKEVLNIPVRNVIASKVTYFTSSEYDVIKFEMDYEFFKKMHKSLKKLPNTQTFNGYKPHMTIAYVKKGRGKAIAEELNNQFKRTLKPSHFVFSEMNGTKTKFDYEKKI